MSKKLNEEQLATLQGLQEEFNKAKKNKFISHKPRFDMCLSGAYKSTALEFDKFVTGEQGGYMGSEQMSVQRD